MKHDTKIGNAQYYSTLLLPHFRHLNLLIYHIHQEIVISYVLVYVITINTNNSTNNNNNTHIVNEGGYDMKVD